MSGLREVVQVRSSPRWTITVRGTARTRVTARATLCDDLTTDVHAAFAPARFLRLGLTGGFVDSHVGSGQRGGVPSTEERFDQATAPGPGGRSGVRALGAFIAFDHRDARASSQRRRVRRALSTMRRSRARPLQLPPGRVRGAALPAAFNRMRVIALRFDDGPVVSGGGPRGAFLPAADDWRERQRARLPALPITTITRLLQRRAPLARLPGSTRPCFSTRAK